ncbi:YdeI/OmpD-associated family protein [Chitinophaga sp.]|uniref:YdeI/OmpD-associated family protein n=1 Tax=Chitinophaga sp. TaxID=1869181 RepID=UPI002F9399D0
MSVKPIVSQSYRLEKFPVKGGWTFARIPEITPDKVKAFGLVRVKGFIDDFEIKKCHLMPLGNGILFLPVKAEIRKKIKKKVGDRVKIVLFRDDDPMDIPEELKICLEDEPGANRFFQSLSESEQRFYINWIFSAKREETKVSRMTKAIIRLSRGLKMYQREEE